MSAAWLWEMLVSFLLEVVSLWWELLMSKVELLVGLERHMACLLEWHCSLSYTFGLVDEGIKATNKSMTPYLHSGICIATWTVIFHQKYPVLIVNVLQYYDNFFLVPVQQHDFQINITKTTMMASLLTPTNWTCEGVCGEVPYLGLNITVCCVGSCK